MGAQCEVSSVAPSTPPARWLSFGRPVADSLPGHTKQELDSDYLLRPWSSHLAQRGESLPISTAVSLIPLGVTGLLKQPFKNPTNIFHPFTFVAMVCLNVSLELHTIKMLILDRCSWATHCWPCTFHLIPMNTRSEFWD